MKYKVYSMYDVVANRYNQPIYYANDGLLQRSVELAVNNPQARENPNSLLYIIRDQRFYQIGIFDDETGKFEGLDVPVLVIDGTSFTFKKE